MIKRTLLFLGFVPLAGILAAEPLVSSWFTEKSGQYARLYESTAAETTGPSAAVTTWNRGQGAQTQPTYSGIHEIAFTATDVYVRTTGLGSHIMGPWYLNEAKTNTFPNYPSNQALIYRIPLEPGSPPASKTLTGLGRIGLFVDGVSMFDTRDAFSYDTSAGQDDSPAAGAGVNGDDIWNRDAYVNESVTFDAANAHQAGSNYHYHANPPALRHLLGDSVDFDPNTNTYAENFNGRHSPIIGWVRDAYPIYGPYGFSNPNDAGSPVTRMRSGFRKRTITVRHSLPAFAARDQGFTAAGSMAEHTLSPTEYGPDVSAQYVPGHYLEDYEYRGDTGETLGTDFDLNEQNGRFCVTPEFPNGTFAYFTSIEADGTPAFPYNIGRTYYGNPTADTVGTIPGDATPAFEGGPEVAEIMRDLNVSETSGDVTIVWDAVQGGGYTVEYSDDMATWTEAPGTVDAAGNSASFIDPNAGNNSEQRFYRATRTSLAPFDDTGFNYDDGGTTGGGDGSGTFNATFPATPPMPPQNAVTSITIGGVTATIVSYDQGTGAVELTFDDSTLAPGNYNATLTFAPGGTPRDVLSTNQYTVDAPPTAQNNNILLLIVDDWGTDASPLDNPGAPSLASMPALASLAASGLRFTNAYAQPVCSPTRASLITGRYAFRTGVGKPGTALPTSEFTLPEAFTAASSPYALATYGKWHLGGGANGAATVGGWPEFAGILQGGVDDYYLWNKNENGVTTNGVTTYTTSDQVNESVDFITAQGSSPWFCWVAFNAPHTPFHEPPLDLLPSNPTGSTNSDLYVKALEAMDTEIARLLQSVDMAKTNVILLGDNGTPLQVVQAPYGNGHAKDDLYEGGVHVPMIATGPDITATGTSDEFVHCVDLFSTILDLAGIDQNVVVPGGTTIDGRSLVPVLQGGDITDGCIVVERFGNGDGNDGRAIREGDFKLIIFDDPDDATDTPRYEFYNVAIDLNEQDDLLLSPLTAPEQSAYDALITKNTALGGGSNLLLPE